MIRLAGVPATAGVPTRIVLGSFSVESRVGLHEVVRAARAGDPEAVADILDRVRRAAPAIWPEVTAAIVVPVPGHLPGPPHPWLVAVSEAIASARGWHLAFDALRRTSPAPEGKTGHSRDPGSEAATLRWHLPALGAMIVLVDDVIRTGATIGACAEALRVAGDERTVVAIALARAEPARG